MTATSRQPSNTLAVAHQKLSTALDEAILEYKVSHRYSNQDEIGRCIERFVGAIFQHPGGRDELESRAKLVQAACEAGSAFEVPRRHFQATCRATPHRLSDFKLAISRLRKAKETPLFLAQIDQERRDIECVLGFNGLRLSPGTRKSLEDWRSACRTIQQESDLLEVDGCWHLLLIHEAGEDKPSELAGLAKSMMKKPSSNFVLLDGKRKQKPTPPDCNIGGANLESIKAAADSLVEWVMETPGRADVVLAKAVKGKKRRGGKKADYTMVQREAEIAAEWVRARDSGVYKPDFARGIGMKVEELDALLSRVHKRKVRADK